MDWDDVRGVSRGAMQLGEDLSALSVAELESRIEALEAETVRVEAEKERKAKQAAAADAMFKS